MSVRFNRDQIHAGVREDVAQCLAIEPEEVNLEVNFFHDLGGESIDMLDLSFRSEKRLGIRSPFVNLTSADGWRFDENGKLSDESMKWLRTEFPHIDWQTRLATCDLHSVKDVVTIDLIVEMLYFAQGHVKPTEVTR